jgi:hypothetical protein
MSNLPVVLRLVNKLSVGQLRRLSHEDLLSIMGPLTGPERSDFMFAKNIKIFGGINGYVEDFLASVPRIQTMNAAKPGAIQTLNRMLTYGDLTSNNRTRINSALALLSGAAAAAGGHRC